MTRIAWPKLMRLGMVEIGLTPEVFWSLTPAELFLIAGFGAGGEALGRAGLESLVARYPDAPGAKQVQPTAGNKPGEPQARNKLE